MPLTPAPILKSKHKRNRPAKNNNPSPLKAANAKLTEENAELHKALSEWKTEAKLANEGRVKMTEQNNSLKTDLSSAILENDRLSKELEDANKPAPKKTAKKTK